MYPARVTIAVGNPEFMTAPASAGDRNNMTVALMARRCENKKRGASVIDELTHPFPRS